MSSVRERRIGPAGAFAIAALLACVVIGSRLVPGAAASFQRDSASAPEFGKSKTLRRALLRSGLLRALPPSGAGAPESRESYGLVPLERAQLATSLRVPQSSLDRGGPVVSLLVDPMALAELDANRYGRGREWERPAYLAFLEEGEVRFASGVGVRIHGGGGRRKKESRGYRIYLRKSHGAAEVSGEVLGPEFAGIELRRFVLRNRSSLLGNPLAFDLMRAAGVPAPRVRPAELLVNGDRAGVFEVSEYIDEHFMEAHFGHRQFALVQTKLNKRQRSQPIEMGDRAEYEEFLTLARSAARRGVASVESRVDLDNLLRWASTIVYCGTRDGLQGSMARDLRNSGAVHGGRWFWIAWDLDLSFTTPKRGASTPWEVDVAWPYFFSKRPPPDPRARLLRGLFKDPAFRRRFADTLLELMNHRFTGEFFEERFRHYEVYAERLGVDLHDGEDSSVEATRRFAELRPAVLRRQIEEYFGVGRLVRLRIDAPADFAFRVDGHPKQGFYEGYYPTGRTVRVATPAGERLVALSTAGQDLRLP